MGEEQFPNNNGDPTDSKDSRQTNGPNSTADASDVEKGPSPSDAPTKQGADLTAKEDFSVFTVAQKRWIIVAGSFAGWFSPMTGSIYFPALNQISSDLNVSDTDVNLTVTTYLIIQGLAPMMIAGFSDKAGRRPAYMICFAIYLVANLGLGLQNNYAALLVLRMLQSAGSSGTIALANGLVGDLVTSSERGSYIAYASVGSILGPSLSPVIGGLLSQYLDWHWIFWFLLILAAAFALPFLLFLPETCRNLVGDGSIPPPKTSWNLSDQMRFANRAKKGIPVDEEKLQRLRENYKLTIPNPISTLVVLSDSEVALLLLATGLALSCFYALSTGASQVFSKTYGFDQLQVGLIFLSIGGGSVIAVFTTGKLVDFNYRRHARKLGYPVTKNRETDLMDFPIEKARLEVALPALLAGAAAVIGYGWLMQYPTSLAGPIIMLFLLGYCLISGFQCLNVLTVDIFPGRPAAATAANNVIRCLLGAAASAAISPMSQAMGYGWAYTTLALIFAVSCVFLLAAMKYGIPWRKRNKAIVARRLERKELKKEQKQKQKQSMAGPA